MGIYLNDAVLMLKLVVIRGTDQACAADGTVPIGGGIALDLMSRFLDRLYGWIGTCEVDKGSEISWNIVKFQTSI